MNDEVDIPDLNQLKRGLCQSFPQFFAEFSSAQILSGICICLMLKTWPLCTGANWISEAEFWVKKKIIALLLCKAKENSRLVPSKTVCPSLGEFGEEFYSSDSRLGSLIGSGCVQGLHSFNLALGSLLMNFCGSQGYQTVTFSMKNASSSS